MNGQLHHAPTLSVVLPYYNEEDYLGATLTSLAAQTYAPSQIILVDNGSSDASAFHCERFKRAHPELVIELMHEARPGKINALSAGFQTVTSDYVAFCDADTIYPPHYVELALALIKNARGECAGAMGLGLTASPESAKGMFQRYKGALAGALLARQCHTGGYGQIFDTQILRAAGGYSRMRWPYMQADHEIAHRMLKYSRLIYHRDLWCRTSTRRTTRKRVSWNIVEMIVYHLTPFALKDWFFYRFLTRRFERRSMWNANLRTQPWNKKEAG